MEKYNFFINICFYICHLEFNFPYWHANSFSITIHNIVRQGFNKLRTRIRPLKIPSSHIFRTKSLHSIHILPRTHTSNSLQPWWSIKIWILMLCGAWNPNNGNKNNHILWVTTAKEKGKQKCKRISIATQGCALLAFF